MIKLTVAHRTIDRMKFSINTNDRQELAELYCDDPQRFYKIETMIQVFEPRLTKSNFGWLHADDCDWPLEVPLLASFGEAMDISMIQWNFGGRPVGSYTDKDSSLRVWVEPILEVYQFKDDLLNTPLDELLLKGFCIFQRRR